MGLRSWLEVKVHDLLVFLAGSPSRTLVVFACLLAGALTGVPVASSAFNYTWRDPNFCDDCHVHDYANTAYHRSVHVGVTTCHDCHRVPLRHYPRNLYVTFLRRPQGPEDIHTPDVESVFCGACHSEESDEVLSGPMTEALRQRVVKVDHSPLHRVHMDSDTRFPGEYRGGHEEALGDVREEMGHALAREGAGEEGITCMDCHGSGGSELAHRFTASRENCIECHEGVDISEGRLSTLRCQECHFQAFIGHSGGTGAVVQEDSESE
jgi:hypothetical protein